MVSDRVETALVELVMDRVSSGRELSSSSADMVCVSRLPRLCWVGGAWGECEEKGREEREGEKREREEGGTRNEDGREGRGVWEEG